MPLKDIAEGWFNNLLDSINLLNEDLKKLGQSRALICKTCPVRSGNMCDSTKTYRKKTGEKFNGCGCFVEAKVLCVNCECPGSFW